MKLLSVSIARALWYFDMNEINPGGKDVFVHLFPSLLQDYKFLTHPKKGEDATSGMRFSNGNFAKADGTVLPVNIVVYNDGLAADTYSSTDDSEEFLREALSKLPSMGFVFDEEMIVRKAYVSQLQVQSAGSLKLLNPKLEEFGSRLSATLGASAFDVAAIEWWADPSRVYKPVSFSFQRKSGDSAKNRYWSQAPLSTAKHLEFLEEFEKLIL